MQQFGTKFGNVCIDLGVRVNRDKKQLGYTVDFLELEFDIIKMKTRLSKNKLDKEIKRVAKLLEIRSSTTHKELQSLVGFFFFVAKVVYPAQKFFQWLYDALAKGRKYLH